MAYTKNSWQTGDTVTAEKLNHAENGIESANQNTLPAVTSDDNGDVLAVVNGAWGKARGSALYEIEAVYDGDVTVTLSQNYNTIRTNMINGKIPYFLQVNNFLSGEGSLSVDIFVATEISDAQTGEEITPNMATFKTASTAGSDQDLIFRENESGDLVHSFA